jgi:threonine/homoserine efflux transporter RhtA
MAVEKCPGRDHTLSWKWWLTTHAGIHGFFVAVITGFVWLGLAEWGVHILIDYGKCRHRYRLGVDQLLHLVCKICWVLAIWLAGELGPVRLLRSGFG